MESITHLDSSIAIPNKLRIYCLEYGRKQCNIDIDLEDEDTNILYINYLMTNTVMLP
jgi:hypothetical protein